MLYLFYLIWLFTILLSLYFQAKDSNMHAFMHSNNGDRYYVCHHHLANMSAVVNKTAQKLVVLLEQKTNFWGHFIYKIILYWLTISFIGITFFYWQAFFRWVKATNETTTPLACFFYNMILHWLRNLVINITFLLWEVLSLSKVSHKNCVRLDMHCSCSFDNRLCNPIYKNW